MKKILLMFLVAFFASANANAQQLVVWLTGGKKVSIKVEDDLSTKFVDSKIVISSASFYTEYRRSQVLRYTYQDVVDDVEAPINGDKIFSQQGDDIMVKGLVPGDNVMLYDMNGILLETLTVDDSRAVKASLSGRPKGAYVLKVGEQSYKFMKR